MPDNFDPRPTIRIDNTITENAKVVGLSDKAFRAYIEALCLCSRQETDGVLLAGHAAKIGPPRVIDELVTAGLFNQVGRDYEVHDYLRHQRSRVEINAYRESRSADGKLGAHLRWHVPRRQRVKDCEFCLTGVESA